MPGVGKALTKYLCSLVYLKILKTDTADVDPYF